VPEVADNLRLWVVEFRQNDRSFENIYFEF